MAVAGKGKKLPIPEGLHPKVQEIIKSCWENVPTFRPSFHSLLEQLGALEQEIQREEENEHKLRRMFVGERKKVRGDSKGGPKRKN